MIARAYAYQKICCGLFRWQGEANHTQLLYIRLPANDPNEPSEKNKRPAEQGFYRDSDRWVAALPSGENIRSRRVRSK